jgi:multidrug efflux pump subunit AcrB
VTESIAEVLKTLGEAMVLVFIVVYLFLAKLARNHHSYAGGSCLS